MNLRKGMIAMVLAGAVAGSANAATAKRESFGTLPDGTPDLARIENAMRCFQAIHAPILAIRFSDDSFATEAATLRVLALYQNCPATQMVLGPSDAGGQKIGHFGFFRSRFRDTLWPRVLKWLQSA